MRFAFLEGDPSDLAVLKKAEVGDAAAVVVAGLGERESKEADALVLTTLLLVQVCQRPMPRYSCCGLPGQSHSKGGQCAGRYQLLLVQVCTSTMRP